MNDPKRDGVSGHLVSPLSDGLGVPWMAGLAECNECDNQWAAVWPLGAEGLECPRCGSANTDRNSYEAY